MALPRSYEAFKRGHSRIWQAYDRLGGMLHEAGPLDEKSRELVKLGISIGGKLEGAVHSHTARALKAGATADEIRHVVLLALTTVGFPSMMAALTWVEDVLRKAEPRPRRVGR
ncbi:MAG: carboxymuconolactone decarboxylase family protein [Candidatus Binatia bacterium]